MRGVQRVIRRVWLPFIYAAVAGIGTWLGNRDYLIAGSAAIVLALMLAAVDLTLDIRRWRNRHSQAARGFEVDTTPSMTLGPLEKKEDNHG
jgi:hypothetical protein